MAELCWVTNYLVLFMSLLLVAGVFYELPLVDQEIARRAWYVFFVLTVGPLGGQIFDQTPWDPPTGPRRWDPTNGPHRWDAPMSPHACEPALAARAI